jgi:hypothetical protein
MATFSTVSARATQVSLLAAQPVAKPGHGIVNNLLLLRQWPELRRMVLLGVVSAGVMCLPLCELGRKAERACCLQHQSQPRCVAPACLATKSEQQRQLSIAIQCWDCRQMLSTCCVCLCLPLVPNEKVPRLISASRLFDEANSTTRPNPRNPRTDTLPQCKVSQWWSQGAGGG